MFTSFFLFLAFSFFLQVTCRTAPDLAHHGVSQTASSFLAAGGLGRGLLYSSRGLNRANRARAQNLRKDQIPDNFELTKKHAKSIGGNKDNIKIPAGHPGLALAGVYQRAKARGNKEEIARGLDPDKGTTGRGHAFYKFLKTAHQPNKAGYIKHLQDMQNSPDKVAQWHKRVDQQAKKLVTGDKSAQAWHQSQPKYQGVRLGHSSSSPGTNRAPGVVHTKSPENMSLMRQAAASQAGGMRLAGSAKVPMGAKATSPKPGPSTTKAATKSTAQAPAAKTTASTRTKKKG